MASRLRTLDTADGARLLHHLALLRPHVQQCRAQDADAVQSRRDGRCGRGGRAQVSPAPLGRRWRVHDERASSTRPSGAHRRFVGSEYSVVHAAPPGLFIIHKRNRSSSTEGKPAPSSRCRSQAHPTLSLAVQTTAVYYIMNDNVYQGPTLYSVINERVVRPVPTRAPACLKLTHADAAHLAPLTLNLALPHPRPKTNLDARAALRMGHQGARRVRDRRHHRRRRRRRVPEAQPRGRGRWCRRRRRGLSSCR